MTGFSNIPTLNNAQQRLKQKQCAVRINPVVKYQYRYPQYGYGCRPLCMPQCIPPEPPKTEPPKTEPPKTEPPKTEPPKPYDNTPVWHSADYLGCDGGVIPAGSMYSVLESGSTDLKLPDGSVIPYTQQCPGVPKPIPYPDEGTWIPVPQPYTLQCDDGTGVIGTVSVPRDHFISPDEQRIKTPNGDVYNRQGFCNTGPVCTYTSADNLLVFGALDLTGYLVAWDLPPLPSLDQSVCVYQKEEIIRDVISFLNTLAGDDVSALNGDISSFLDGAEYTAKALGANFADLAAAAIEFGRGNFDEAFINILESIPGWGNLIGDAIEKLGLGRILKNVVNQLSEDQKQNIIDFAIDGLATASAIPNPASPLIVPLCALITSTIMFGRMQWDEAVFNLLSLGLSKIAGKLIGKLTNTPPIQGPVTAAGQAPAAPATTMSKIMDALKQVVQPIVDALKGPLLKIAQQLGVLDASGNPTAATQVLIDHYEAIIAAATAVGGVVDLIDGTEDI